MQASFSKGEISPLLHARVDLAAYSTGLMELKNMLVLPQGGVTRRPGFTNMNVDVGGTSIRKVIPFEFNSTDTALIVFSGGDYIYIYGNVSGNFTLLTKITNPYYIGDIQDIDYVQSGNVIFLAHKKYKTRILRRVSLNNWTFEEFKFQGGPFIDSNEWGATQPLTLTISGNTRTLTSTEDIFNADLVGTLVKLEYPIEAQKETVISVAGGNYGMAHEVKGTLNVTTTGGDWRGKISIERSSDNGTTWITVREYERTNTTTQGQWDFTITETEENILYRVVAAHYGEKNPSEVVVADSSSDDDFVPVRAHVLVSGFLKSGIFRITNFINTKSVRITRQKNTGIEIGDSFSGTVSLWSIGSWGNYQGYPGSVAMYQDRLVFASTKLQPQTIWLSRTGDYADFSISSTLKDDDAVNITLAGSSADGIHSLITTGDLLAFTNSGEWKISGAGDNGAITPSALTAHQQTNIGTKNIKPIVADGRIIVVQAQGEKIYSLGYDLNTDGYVGSEITILSNHIFESKEIVSIAYQRTPDSLIWVAFSDNTFASCTYNPEHEIIGWAQHESAYLNFGFRAFIAIQGINQTEIFGIAIKDALVRFCSRYDGVYTDCGISFESILRTLRININSEDGSMLTNKKLISRVFISTLNSGSAWIAPGGLNDDRNWERRRKITFENTKYLTDSELQLDSGFDNYACILVKSIDQEPLTVAAITPLVTLGG